MLNHDIPAKITDVTTLSPGDNVVLIEFDGETPRNITYAAVSEVHDTLFTLGHFNEAPQYNGNFSDEVCVDYIEYFTHLGPHGAVREKGAKPNVYAQRGTYLYDTGRPLAPYMIEWAEHCAEAHALHKTLTESAIAIRLHNGEADMDDLYDIREYVDEIIVETEYADIVKEQLDKRLAEYD